MKMLIHELICYFFLICYAIGAACAVLLLYAIALAAALFPEE